ncbi:MAG: CDP-alcohol phosphatidyltransferase family protein [Gammaproteobacteria bacterium]|jgi:cardiolipin synthase
MQLFRLAYIPNWICVIRIFLVVPIVWLLVSKRYELALMLIVLAGVSDGIDGLLARRFDWTSRVGGLLDPLADKLLFVAVFASLTWDDLIPVWLFAVVIGRDIIIVSGALAYEYLIGPVEPKPTKASKINTGLALVYLFFVMSWQIYGWPPEVSITIAGAGVFVVSLVSGMDYVLTWSRLALNARASS